MSLSRVDTWSTTRCILVEASCLSHDVCSVGPRSILNDLFEEPLGLRSACRVTQRAPSGVQLQWGGDKDKFWETRSWPGPSAENLMRRGFLLYKFWGILPGIFLEDFSGHFFPQNEKNPATKSVKKSGGPKIKICEKSVLPKTDPNRSRR